MGDFLVFWLLVMSFQDISYCDIERYVYVHENDTVTLSCSLDVAVWWGPSNLTTYVSGKELDPQFSKYNRLTFSYNQTTNTSELQIQVFSKEDEGLYRCSYLENGKLESIEETVLIKRDPKNITILGANDTILFANSNDIVNLTCCVESGIPANETIIWIGNEIELSRGGPSVLTYTFTPNVEHHLLNFSCIVLTGTILLQTHIQLFLYFPPTIHISQGHFLNVLEGTTLDLKCEYTSNSKIKDIMWQHDSKIISNASQLHFESIKREYNGTYSCTVVNQAATVYENVTIEVVYQPDVTISFSNNDGIRQLTCVPNGFPDQYEFSNWEHISEFREHIRYFPPTKSGKLYIPFISMETDRHYDTGVYICSVSNNVSVDGRKFVSAEYWLKNSGKPYFVASNSAVQYSILGQKSVLTADVRNFEKLIDVALNSDDMTKYNNSKILKSSVIVRDNVYGKHVMVRVTRLIFPITTQTIDDFRQFIVVVNSTIGSSSYVISLRPTRPPRTPEHVRAVAMDHSIIVRWTVDLDSGLQKHFIVKYRKHFDQSWSQISVVGSSTATITGLEPHTVYLVRVYSKTGAGESEGTAEIIVKTDKHHYKVQVLSADFAVIIGTIILLMFLCCCGSKALKNRQSVSRKKESNSTKRNPRIDEISSRNDETSTRLDHYDEITSSYYHPQGTRNNTQQEIHQPLNSNEHLETYSVSCKHITPKPIQQDSQCQENVSSRSSSEESYLAPCRSYVNTDLTNNTKYESPDINTVSADIHLLEELSITSDNSETNMKGILKYESLQVSDTNEHAYNKYNDTTL